MKEIEERELSQDDKEIAEYHLKICKLDKAEQTLSNLAEADRNSKQEEEFKSKMRCVESQYQADSLNYFQSWAFLKHTNALNLEMMEQPKLKLLDNSSEEFRILIRRLDTNCSPRMSIRVGVIYVRSEQYDQHSILSNTEGSEQYEQLLQYIGKPLHNNNFHKSLIGQPDILYHATATHELIFHVSTKMPTIPDDDQQIEKKKYIGSDLVHIVWCENDREYRPGTITSDLNFVHLIVHPLRNGMYRMRVKKKKDKEQLVKFFGPLLTGMVLPMRILPTLLKYTTINARHSIIFKNSQLYNLLSDRKSMIKKIILDHPIKQGIKTSEEFKFIDNFIRLGMTE